MAIRGLQVLYNLILKDIVKGSGQASGILSIGKDVRKLADKKLQRYITTAKKQGVDLDSLSEQEIKYMLELNKPKAPQVLSNEDAYAFLNKFLNQGKKGEVIKGKFGKSFSQEVDDIADKKVIEQMYRTSGPRSLDEDAGYLAEFIAEDAGKVLDDLPIKEQTKFIERAKNALRKNVKQYQPEEVVNVDSVITDIKKLDPMDSMKETNKVLRGEGQYKNLSKADREKIAGDESVTDHIFERNIEPDPEDFAYGGVAGLLGERPGYNEGKTAKKSFIKLIPQFTEKGEQIPVFSKTGKQQIEGAPEGITSDKEVFNLIVGLDIPITEKINILGDIGFSKFRDKIEKGDEELFLMDQASNVNKNIGIGYEDDGLSGSIMYNPDTKYKQFQISKKFAQGGRVPMFIGGKVSIKILNLLKDKKKIKEAYDNIFPTGDYKYDADAVAESLVENNPKIFKNRLYGDLTDAERFEVYGAALDESSTNFAKALQLKRAMRKASKPTKTLKSIEETGTINISDEGVADEFAKFMKETDPEGAKKIEQTLELSNFNPKGRRGNASGGIAKLLGE